MAENRIVSMPPVSRTISLPLTNINAIVDVSSSMQGPKIEAVCSSIRSMFMSWPPGVNFQLTVFNDSTTTIVSGPKRNIKIEDAINGIKRICFHGVRNISSRNFAAELLERTERTLELPFTSNGLRR